MTFPFSISPKVRSRIIASGLCAVLAASALGNFCMPAGAASWDADTSDYRISAVEVDAHADPLPEQDSVVSLTHGDLHGYTLSVDGSASTGYCRIAVSDDTDEGSAVYYISPMVPGSTVYLVLQVASGSSVAFEAVEGKLPEGIPSQQVVAPEWVECQDGSTVLTAHLQISETPSISYHVTDSVTLEGIAGYYDVSPQDILTFNGVDDIAPGDVIRIPNLTANVPYAPIAHYVVKSGDTLKDIADTFQVPMRSLAQWNEIGSNGTIYPGLELEIPVIYKKEAADIDFSFLQPENREVDHTLEERVCGVPAYFQGDYPDDRYADGTIATSGCSITALTMVANAVTNYDYTVDELAEYFGGRAENNMQRLEIGSETLGLDFYKSINWDYTWKALQEGAIVIALMEGNSLFTDTQHFIVLTGLTEDGQRILVNDPNAGNYNLWNLKKGFENGFKPEDILLGYSGAWVYKRTLEEMPERYSEVRLSKMFKMYEGDEDDPDVAKLLAHSNYPEIRLNMEERDLLAKVIWAEARGESAAGQQAVAEVVFNRLLSPQFGDDLNDVIYSKGQFRSVDKLEEAEPTQAQYQAIERALLGTPVLNRKVFYFAPYPSNDTPYVMIDRHIFCY